MSINVDKMDSKHNSSQKSKPVMKRRKKNSSTSDLSSDSLSPKKYISNGYPSDYRSSPETTLNSTFHSTLPDGMNGSLNTSNGHHRINGNDMLKSPDHVSDSSMMEVVSQSGSTPSTGSQSPTHMADANHHFDDSDSTSSINKSRRQPRTPEDFYLFCQFILEYANYNEMCSQDALRSSTHSPLDSTGSATESTISSAANEESSHAISNGDSNKDEELDGKDLDGSNTMPNDTSSDDVNKTMSAIDASSTNEDDDSDIDADSYNLITCYCGKPYAARPMIECSKCLTWLHLSCAKIKRKNIPDVFICVKCAKKTSGQQTESTPTHPKDLQTSSEPKENNRSKKSNTTPNSTPQTRSDKIENNILQPLNVSATYETGANNLDNIKTSSNVSSIAVKYK